MNGTDTEGAAVNLTYKAALFFSNSTAVFIVVSANTLSLQATVDFGLA